LKNSYSSIENKLPGHFKLPQMPEGVTGPLELGEVGHRREDGPQFEHQLLEDQVDPLTHLELTFK
jgi:hypothetical protein